jgi:hypothetical protein
MALSKTLELTTNFDTKVTFEDAYIRVNSVNFNKEISEATVVFLKSELDVSALQIRKYTFIAELDGHNPIKQAYEYLKTLPEFANATDC